MAPIDRDFTMDDLDAALDAVGVRAAVLVQSSNSIAETRRLLVAASASTSSCDGTKLPLAETIPADVPHVRFVLDHLGNPPLGTPELSLWERSLRSLASHPNTSAKPSNVAGALGRLDWTADMCRGTIEVALDAFGPDRLMYGSDWPLVELVGGPARWQQAVAAIVADLSPGERDSIFGATAARVYGMRTR